MKPKNRVFCPFCGYLKMLFSSEKKANNYLKFNANTVLEENGRKPIRAYFCEACGGWHVTSSKSFIKVNEKDKTTLYDGNISRIMKSHNKGSDIQYEKIKEIMKKIKKEKESC